MRKLLMELLYYSKIYVDKKGIKLNVGPMMIPL